MKFDQSVHDSMLDSGEAKAPEKSREHRGEAGARTLRPRGRTEGIDRID